jgi:hypothetical protein
MSMNALALTREEAPQNVFESVMRKLVNIDRIDEPAEGVVALTMLKKEEAKKAPKGKSRPLPPSAVGMVGVHATLGQMKQVNPVSMGGVCTCPSCRPGIRFIHSFRRFSRVR